MKEEKVLSEKKIIIVLQIMNIIFSLNNVLVKCASSSWKENGLFHEKTIFLTCMAVFILACYAVLWQMILKQVNLSVAYLSKGLVVFWGLLWAYFIFDEKITLLNIIGAIVIFVGTLLINERE
ncbi:MAG: EamA family transporter [Roseburia sp.]|nr:EamA family transporter [Roseburia sp.]